MVEFLKSLVLPSLIFVLSLLHPFSLRSCNTCGHLAGKKLQWLIKRIVCLLWGAPWGPSGLHTEPFDPRKFISSRCFPHRHLSAMSFFIMYPKNKYSRPTAAAYNLSEWSVTGGWHLIEPLGSHGLRHNDGGRLTLSKAELGLFSRHLWDSHGNYVNQAKENT